MTTSVRTTIELSDILAIEFECKKCHAKVVRPITENTTIPSRCYCADSQWFILGSGDHADITSICNLIGRHKELSERAFAMRLEITTDTSK